MKITGVETKIVNAIHRNWIFVKVLTDQPGLYGWGEATLEWKTASPPAEYNFAEIPQVTSRYPMWDESHPELTVDVPHTHAGDKQVDVEVGGRHVGDAAVPDDRNRLAPGHISDAGGHVPTAAQLGILMPNPSAMPIVVAFFMVLMFAFMIFFHTGHPGLAIWGMIGSALAMTAALLNWLLTPLEDHH